MPSVRLAQACENSLDAAAIHSGITCRFGHIATGDAQNLFYVLCFEYSEPFPLGRLVGQVGPDRRKGCRGVFRGQPTRWGCSRSIAKGWRKVLKGHGGPCAE